MSSVSIAEGLGTNIYGLKGYLDGALLGVTCYKCRKEFKIEVKSRAQVKDFSKSPQECPECEGKRKHEYEAGRAQRDLESQQRQAHLEWLHTMPYRQYLESPEWQETRMRKLKRAHFRCELCNKQGKLNVHHKTYERRGYEDDRDLIVLCGTCHAKFHDKLPPSE